MEIPLKNTPQIKPISTTEFNVHQINSIATKYPDIRSKSKGPTFSLTYQGTEHTLMNDLGFSKEDSLEIKNNYHDLYKVSDDWVQAKLDEAAKTGYVVTAFGLKVRTPLLSKSLRNSRHTPYEAQAEGRTAGNALGQGYGLLNNRACNAFMKRVWASPYKLDILPVAMIHDAIYLIIRNNPKVVAWVNKELISAMQWQELPELKHDTVKLGADLSLFYPTWAHELTISNTDSIDQIIIKAKQHIETLKKA